MSTALGGVLALSVPFRIPVAGAGVQWVQWAQPATGVGGGLGHLLLTLPRVQRSSERALSVGTVAKNSGTAAGQFHLVAER